MAFNLIKRLKKCTQRKFVIPEERLPSQILEELSTENVLVHYWERNSSDRDYRGTIVTPNIAKKILEQRFDEYGFPEEQAYRDHLVKLDAKNGIEKHNLYIDFENNSYELSWEIPRSRFHPKCSTKIKKRIFKNHF